MQVRDYAFRNNESETKVAELEDAVQTLQFQKSEHKYKLSEARAVLDAQMYKLTTRLLQTKHHEAAVRI